MRKIPTRLFTMQNGVTVKPFNLIDPRLAIEATDCFLKLILCWEKQQATCSAENIYCLMRGRESHSFVRERREGRQAEGSKEEERLASADGTLAQAGGAPLRYARSSEV